MSKKIIRTVAALAAAYVVSSAAPAFAAAIMPDFATVPVGWTVDRYAPATFANVGTYEGRTNVLGIGISSADGLLRRPSAYQSTFYNTQGRQHALSGGAGSLLSADLYIPETWSSAGNGSVRTDIWGVMTDGSAVTGYPIIGFTNYGGAARFQVWEDTAGAWIALETEVEYDAWTTLAIGFTGQAFEFFVNGERLYTDTTVEGSTGFSAVIMQAYNFGGDYVAHWANTVPEPASIALFGVGVLFVGLMRRRSSRA